MMNDEFYSMGTQMTQIGRIFTDFLLGSYEYFDNDIGKC
jgi:hypothetical protein